MAQGPLDCQNIPSDEYDCSNPWPNCTSRKGFDSQILWNLTKSIRETCPNDSRLFTSTQESFNANKGLSLTHEACVNVAGASWTAYSRSIIWHRILSWQFPLLQMALIFPRPPLGFTTELFTVFHLLGDPIDTIANLLARLFISRYSIGHWQDADLQGIKKTEKLSRAFAVITDSYSEWGKDEEAGQVLTYALYVMFQFPHSH